MAAARNFLGAGVVLLGAMVAWGADTAPLPNAASGSRASPADRYIRAAYLAELAGDDSQRADMLAHALTADPSSRAARWLSGYVTLGGKWLTEAETARKYSADPKLIEYRQRREQAATRRFAHSRHGVWQRREHGWRRGGLARLVGRYLSDQCVDARGHCHQHRVGSLVPRQAAPRRGASSLDPSAVRRPDEHRSPIAAGHAVVQGQPLDQRPDRRNPETGDPGSAGVGKVEADRRTVAGALNSGSPGEQTAVQTEMAAVSDPAVIPALEWADVSDSPKPPAARDAATPFQREAIALLGPIAGAAGDVFARAA